MSDLSWVGRFLDAHRRRFGPPDWPAPGAPEFDDFLGDWIFAFRRLRVTREEAEAASRRLLASPPVWRREHVPAVLGAVRAARAELAPGVVARALRAAPPTEDETTSGAWSGADEATRERWRAEVLARMPFLRRHPAAADRLAAAWMLDPSLAPPAPAPAPGHTGAF